MTKYWRSVRLTELFCFHCDYNKHVEKSTKKIIICIYFISTWLYYNQIVVTFRLGTRLSSSNQIYVLNTPLYCRKVTIVKQHYHCRQRAPIENIYLYLRMTKYWRSVRLTELFCFHCDYNKHVEKSTKKIII
jgi:hypothetical protein